jgi:Transmembrane amino acid transporter protein
LYLFIIPHSCVYISELPITTFARICVSAIVICHYPLQANPARRSALTLWKSMAGGSQEPSPALYAVRYASITVRISCQTNSRLMIISVFVPIHAVYEHCALHYVVIKYLEFILYICEHFQIISRIYVYLFQVVFLVASLLIALSVNDLGVVLSIVGATGSTVVSYILPGVFYSNMFSGKIARTTDNSSVRSSHGSHRYRNESGSTVMHSGSSATIGAVGGVGGMTADSSESSSVSENTDYTEDADIDSEDSHEHLVDGKHAAWKLMLAKVQLIAGLVIMPVCLIAIFLK